MNRQQPKENAEATKVLLDQTNLVEQADKSEDPDLCAAEPDEDELALLLASGC